VRVVTLESGGVPGTLPADFEERDSIAELIESQTLTGRAATLEDVGNAAAFAASDKALPMTAATINVSAGALID
jgi:3-oxoacyl-[acyl-carrier protein] reductase